MLCSIYYICSTILHSLSSRERGHVNLIFSPNLAGGVNYKLSNTHPFECFVTLVIEGGAMAKFWPLHHSQCMGENSENTLSTILYSLWQTERVNQIFPLHLAGDVD